jgi:DNA polymerase III subunit epsilon
MGLKPGNPVGVIRGRKYDVYLYDPNNPESAIPKKPATPKQLEALAKGRESQQFEAAYKEWYSENGRRYRDRNRSIRWAKNILDNADKWLILDTETTGISKAEIVKICILGLSSNVILDRLVKPTISIPSEASNIHGISDSYVQNAPSFPLIYPEIKSALVDKNIIIYNAQFDLSILDY